MPNEPPIIQELILKGVNEARKQLQSLGKDGEDALNELTKAGAGDFGKGLEAAAPAFQNFLTALRATGGETRAAQRAFNEFQTSWSNLLRAAGGRQNWERAAEPIRETGDAVDVVAASTRKAVSPVRTLIDSFRLLGQTTASPEISRLASALVVLQRSFAALAIPLAIVGLAGIARSAANAADAIVNAAQAANTTVAGFGQIQTVMASVGLGFKEAAQVANAFTAAIKKTDAESRAAAQAYEQYRQQIDDIRDATSSLVTNYSDLSRAASDLTVQQGQAISAGKVTIDQINKFSAAQANLTSQYQKNADAIAKQDAQQRRLEKSYRASRQAAEEAGTGLTQLGIKARGAGGDLVTVDAVMQDFAEAFKNFPNEAKRSQIANELFGDSAARMIPILKGGAAAMKAFQAEGQRIAPAFTEAQTQIGVNFVEAAGRMQEALASLKNQFGIELAPIFTENMKAITEAIVAARPQIIEFAKAIGPALQTTLSALGALISNIIVPALNGLGIAFTAIADIINSVFGSNVTGAGVFLTALLVTVTALVFIFGGWIPVITAVAIAIGALINQIAQLDWKPLKDGAKAAWDFIVSVFNGQFFVDLFNSIWASAVEIFNKISQSIVNAFNSVLAYLSSTWIGKVLSVLSMALDKLKEFFGASQSAEAAASQAASGSPGFARGGMVRGPGSGTSDTAGLFRLSDKEFVVRAAAVRKYGASLLYAINSLKFDPRMFEGFASGGLVTAGARAGTTNVNNYFAEGRSVRSFDLVLDGHRFSDLSGDEDTITSLEKFAVQKRISSGGKRPAWKGRR